MNPRRNLRHLHLLQILPPKNVRLREENTRPDSIRIFLRRFVVRVDGSCRFRVDSIFVRVDPSPVALKETPRISKMENYLVRKQMKELGAESKRKMEKADRNFGLGEVVESERNDIDPRICKFQC